MTDEREEAIPESADHVAVLYPSKYLRKEDLHHKDVTLTIEKITLRDVRMTTGGTERKVTVHFQEMQKRPAADRKVWIVPKTAALQIAELHGSDPRAWPGKRVTLYHDEAVSFGPRRVGGIRVRPKTAEKRMREPGED